MGEERKVYKVLVGKPEGKRPRRRWEDGIRRIFGRLAWGFVDWIRLAQDRGQWLAVVSAVMNLRVLAPRSWLVILAFGNTKIKDMWSFTFTILYAHVSRVTQ
jgi:hypothetical protein